MTERMVRGKKTAEQLQVEFYNVEITANILSIPYILHLHILIFPSIFFLLKA